MDHTESEMKQCWDFARKFWKSGIMLRVAELPTTFPFLFPIIIADFSQYPANRQCLSDDEIVEVASKIGIADPNKDDGALNTVNRMEALIWLICMGVSGLSPPEARALSNEEVIENLRYALWSSQRIDNLFHGKTYLTSSKLDVPAFPA
ncbi:hypothetical protein DFS33DRAFT_1482179 [Desarmillaria ectypa]|nr:hypothetical protein DFS33DRAFT_1482179 [Desarmillaria ectypa]